MSPFSGDTCAGRARTAATLSLLGLLLLATVPFQLGLAGTAAAAAAASSPASAPSLSLGFGPSSLSPISGGVPVYTTGETIWVESAYNYSVTLSLTSAPLPNGSAGAVVATKPLDPDAVAPLYTFTPADPDGVWNITLASAQGSATTTIPVRLVNLVSNNPVALGPIQYSLDGGNLSISAQTELGNSYDQEVCAVGSAPEPAVTLNLPRDMGDSGTIALTPGNLVGITILGTLTKPLSFWFELYQPYALDTTAANNLVTDNLMAAKSQPFDVISSGPSSTALTWNTPLREGRYDLRAFFQNSTSLEVFESRVLVLNDSSWISLSGACLPQAIQSSGISYSANLTGGQADWPKTLYVMYRTFGVEAVNPYPVKANLSSVNFIASPWGEPLQDGKATVSTSSGALQTSQEGGSLFVLASRYPVQLNYSLAVAGEADITLASVTIDRPYSTQNVNVSSAELTAHVLGDQSSPITLEATSAGGANITSGPLQSGQTVTFFLPAGSYTVTALQAGASESAKVGLTDGLATAVTLNFNATPIIEIILAVTAAIAAVANLLIWYLRSRSLSSRMAGTSKRDSSGVHA